MKKIFTFIAAIASVAFVASCAKELVPSKPSAPAEENTVTLVVDANIEAVEEESAQPVQADTRTVISGSTIKWSSSGEKITVYEKATTSGDVSMVSKASNVGSSSDSYVTMSFNVTMDSKTADNFTYYGSYPSSANVSTNKTQAKANLETKFAQTPVAASFDPSADLMISKSVDNDDAQATSLSMQFARVVAIGKMTITNLPVDEYVTKVTFSANNGSDVILAGRTNFDLETATPVTDYGDALAKTELSLNTSALSAKATSSMDVWFTCYPFELTTGDTFTVVVEAGAYQVSRTVTIPSARELNFEEGKVSRFSVDMSAADVAMQQPWVLYEGAITAGDYLIVSAGKAMKASVTSDRFDYTTVSAVDDEIYTNDATLVWRAAASSTYWTLYNPDSGMYAASTGAKNKAQLLDSGSDDMSLWSVTGDGTYEFVNKKNTANSVNANLRYNPGSGWACYGTGTGSASLLYKKDSRPYLATPASVTAALNGSDSSVIDVTFGTVANAGSYVIVAKTALDVTIIKEDVASSPATISVADGLAYNTEYTIAVYAVPSNPASYRNSLKKEAASTVTTGSAPTPSLGTMIWQEDFTGWTAFRDNVSGVSNVYGGGIVDYSTSASCTYQNDALAGGDKPEILISSNSAGQFIVKNLPIYKATSATLFYNTNYDYCSLSTSVGATVTAKSYNSVGPKVKVWEITSIPADTDLFDITLTNTNKDKNCRTDNFILKAGTKLFQSLSYSSATVNWVIGTDCTVDVATAAPQSVSGANTTVSYSSSDPTTATVNASTGAITVKKKGTVVITATAAESGSYWGATTSYTLSIAEGNIVLEWSRSGSSNTCTSGFTFYQAAEAKTGYYQDGTGSLRYVGAYHTTNKLFSGALTSVTVKATIGGGTVRNPLGNSVYVCFVDNTGADIDGSAVELTNKVEVTTGKEYSASMSTAKAADAYGIKIYHTKETSYNVRYYSFSVEYE